MSETKVKIVQEWSWYCPKCCARNCEQPVVAELSEEEKAEMKAEHGFSEFVEGDFLTMPTVVTCSECGETFDAEATDDVDVADAPEPEEDDDYDDQQW